MGTMLPRTADELAADVRAIGSLGSSATQKGLADQRGYFGRAVQSLVIERR